MEKEEAKFIIIDNNNEELLSFETVNGIYEMELPYGEYNVKQISGKDNYKFVEDFNISITEDNITQEFNLYDEALIEEKEEPINDEIGDIAEPVFEIEEKEIIYDIPDTYIKSTFFDIKTFLLILSMLLLRKDKTNEEE